jgi:hypothetical protein
MRKLLIAEVFSAMLVVGFLTVSTPVANAGPCSGSNDPEQTQSCTDCFNNFPTGYDAHGDKECDALNGQPAQLYLPKEYQGPYATAMSTGTGTGRCGEGDCIPPCNLWTGPGDTGQPVPNPEAGNECSDTSKRFGEPPPAQAQAPDNAPISVQDDPTPRSPSFLQQAVNFFVSLCGGCTSLPEPGQFEPPHQ